MNDNEEKWEDPLEENGLTLGPEETLQREIEKSKSLNIIVEAKGKDVSAYEWLSWNKDQLQGTFITVPERLQIPENIKEQLIVELYSK